MPRGRSKAVRAREIRTGKEKESWRVEFCDIPLSKEDKEALVEWWPEDFDLLLWIEAQNENGYKVSFSYDFYNDCSNVSLIATRACTIEANAGLCMVSRGSSMLNAIKACLYRLAKYCADGVWPRDIQGETDDFD